MEAPLPGSCPSGCPSYPTAAAAVSDAGADEAVDGLEGTERHLAQAYDQQVGEESQVLRHDAFRCHTHIVHGGVG